MEDFIERVGQSYLERKAFAVPQQLENFAKKQFSGGGDIEAEAKKSTGKKGTEEEEEDEEEGEGKEEDEQTTKKKGSGKTAGQALSASSEKDKEIARLKKQLARAKLESPKTSSGKSAPALKGQAISRASNGQKAFTSKAAKGGKETKELAALGAVGAVGGRLKEKKKNKSGDKEASGSKLAREANIVEISPTKRKTSTIQHSKDDGGDKSEHGSRPKSEHGGHAESTTSHAAAASEGQRRPSTASRSEHGSTAKSIAPAPVHKPLPTHAEGSGNEKALVESRRSRRRIEQERDLYKVEVEEEVPRRRKKDAGGVVEVESSKGKTLYRVG
ncbi:hypothetical protein IMSHALPRED_007050 [Imshaugia aleurites]|uniref:Uncharacterized protein n=1 Tax=Imshaugia aleurites TaxID=172621 RepID=A0A8H3FLH7_9LECA|nr:hypothetical protein IMSHALPRED_007050 [Imshaugia aleurites]